MTNRTEITNAAGIKFYVERSKDFDDAGRMTDGRGWFAGIIDGNNDTGGIFFETRESALDAIASYGGC